jgi:hypothetical protein
VGGRERQGRRLGGRAAERDLTVGTHGPGPQQFLRKDREFAGNTARSFGVHLEEPSQPGHRRAISGLSPRFR